VSGDDLPSLRAGDDDRERALERLRDAAVEGRLTLEELAGRIEHAHVAQTVEDLTALTADLEAPATAAPQPAPERQRAIASRLARSGRWRVPAHARFLSVCGTVELDLRQAVLPGPRVELEVTSWFGTTTILVPEGVEVELDAGGLSGTTELQLSGEPPPQAPLLHVRARGGFGTLRIRSRPRQGGVAALLGRAGAPPS
jgi:Domain of unknown function (DUF1707)/Cell wall-active antibiotics response 4TMS YvqF